MPESRFITHKGKEILLIDFSHAVSKEEVFAVIEKAKELIVTRPPQSVLTLTDITEAFFDGEVSQALKQLAIHDKPYVKTGAVVGVRGARKIIYNAVMFFSKRHLELHDDVESAKEWLCEQ